MPGTINNNWPSIKYRLLTTEQFDIDKDFETFPIIILHFEI